jgi:hypothetical protein
MSKLKKLEELSKKLKNLLKYKSSTYKLEDETLSRDDIYLLLEKIDVERSIKLKKEYLEFLKTKQK